MTEAEVIDRINSTIKKNGKNAITGEEMNFVLKAIIQLIADAGGTVNWGDIEGTIADQLDLASELAGKEDALGFTPENSANKGIAGGYAALDGGGKIPSSNLPSTVLKYISLWNPVTNSPTLTNPDATKAGNVYIVSVAGSRFGISWNVGDWLIYNDTGVVEKSDNSDDIVSVNGYTGIVVLNATDVDALARNGSNANADVDLGAFALNAKSVKINGTAGSGHISMKHQSAGITASASESALGANSSGNPVWKNDGNAIQEIALLDTVLSKLGLFIYKQSTPNTAVTGSGELICGSVPIGSNRLATTDKLIVDCTFVKTTTLGTYTLKYYLAPNSNNLTGAVEIARATGFAATAVFIPTFPRNYDVESGNLKGFPFTQSAVLPTGTSNPISTTPFNVANAFHFITTVQFTNASDSGYLNSQLIKNF